MKTLTAFMKKEWMEQLRTGRFFVLSIIFIFIGIMNPATAKLTPWLFETLADTLSEDGIQVTNVTVDAMTSWMQFFKNIPLGLLVFILLESNIFTKEYQSGTLLLALTKGYGRYKVILSKSVILMILWSVYYWICFAITYGYNEFFWDNSVARNLLFAIVCWWLFGVWVIMISVLLSTIAKANTGVLAGTGAILLGAYLIRLLPKVKTYSPITLVNSAALLDGAEKISSYRASIVMTLLLCVVCVITSILLLDRKQL